MPTKIRFHVVNVWERAAISLSNFRKWIDLIINLRIKVVLIPQPSSAGLCRWHYPFSSAIPFLSPNIYHHHVFPCSFNIGSQFHKTLSFISTRLAFPPWKHSYIFMHHSSWPQKRHHTFLKAAAVSFHALLHYVSFDFAFSHYTGCLTSQVYQPGTIFPFICNRS